MKLIVVPKKAGTVELYLVGVRTEGLGEPVSMPCPLVSGCFRMTRHLLISSGRLQGIVQVLKSKEQQRAQ